MRGTARALTLAILGLLAPVLPAHGGYSAPTSTGAPIPVSLAPYTNNTALAASGGGDFDGSGDAYPASAIPNDAPVVGGVPYAIPSGNGDNVVALGQTIAIPPGRYALAYLLVAGSSGEAAGTATVRYARGSSTGAALDAPDWHRGPGDPSLSSPITETRTGAQHQPAGIYAEEVWFDPSRLAISLTLPTTHAPAPDLPSMHVFALTLQPVVAGEAIKVIDARSTAKTLRDGAQVVEATVENVGARWYTRSAPATIRVVAKGITTADPGTVRVLAPGEQTPVEIGIRTTGRIRAGAPIPATVVARTAGGAADRESVSLTAGVPPYAPTVASLSRHAAPDWYDAAKFGIFIHYGLYSVPAWAPVGGVYEEWYWHSMLEKGSPTYRHQLQTYGPDSGYDDFIARFTARRFDPRTWVELFKAAGARYFVFVAKHHDGFALFRTARSRRSSVDMGPHKDLVGLLFAADRRYTPGIHPGVYYSLPEWYNPAFHGTRLKTDHFPGGPPHQFVTGQALRYTGYMPVRDYVRDYQAPQMLELIDQYHPDILWCDIGGPNDSLNVIAHFYNEARDAPHPHDVAVNNRCGVSVHDFTTPEQRLYDTTVEAKWETSRGIDPHSYGYNAATPHRVYATARDLVDELVDVVSKNGNLLLDIGPHADGTIPRIMQRRLRQIGAWLRVNGEAIYGSIPWWRTPQDGDLRFTVRKDSAFYITSLARPGPAIVIHAPVPIRPGDRVTLLGRHGRPLRWSEAGGELTIHVPPRARRSGQYAWTFKIAYR